jgi:hypothetical protein
MKKVVFTVKAIVLVLAAIFLFTQGIQETRDKVKLEDGFINPSIENRPMAFWPWLNGYVDTTRMVYELEEMKSKGMQGAFIWDVGALIDPGKTIPAGPEFLGKQSLGYISLALKNADRLGLNLGMFTQSSWNVGGPWIGEADAVKEMLSVNQVVEGPTSKMIEIGIPKNRKAEPRVYSLITSIAKPYSRSKEIDYTRDKIINLDEFTSEGKVIKWAVPEGKWEIVSFFMCNTGQELVCPSPNSRGLMIDHLSKRATQIHFDTLFARLAKVNSHSKSFKYLEVDSYEVRPSKDWTPGFLLEFKSRFGYDAKPFLPLLMGYKSKDTIVGKRFAADYSRLVSDMMIENHYAQSTDVTNKHGMKLFAEAGHGGEARVDPLKALGNVDVPMGEFWNRQRHWITKEAASAAHIYGKTTVASESLTSWQNWQHGPTDYKQLCDVAFCEGLNQIVFHTFTHNPEMAGKPGFVYHAGEHINVNTTWWEMARPFMDYLGRCSYMLRQGNFVGDVLLYYGDDAPNLVPPKRMDPNYTPDMPGIFPTWFYDETKCPHCGMPKSIIPGDLSGYDYDYINADVITTALSSENGKFTLPNGSSYRVMMIPDRKDISLEVLKKLEKLVYEGAVIVGPKPERTTSLKNYPACDKEVKALAAKIWGTCDGKSVLSNKYGKGTVYWGKTLKQVLRELAVPCDLEITGTNNSDHHIDYIHRQTGTDDIYFVSNSKPQSEKINCIFRVDKDRVPELWDAETGLIQRKLEYTKVENGIRIDFTMDPLASRFVVFRKESTGKNDAGLGYDLQFGFHQNRGSIPDPINISDNWNIKFNPAMGGPQAYHLDSLKSWSDIGDEGIKYYSGSATYERDFNFGMEDLTKETEAFAVFGDIQEMARVLVNGHDCGIVWTIPYKAKITPWLKKGNNTITVQVINTWNNRIVGDLRNPDKKPFASTNGKIKFNKNSPLLKSGMMGKAEIQFLNINKRKL